MKSRKIFVFIIILFIALVGYASIVYNHGQNSSKNQGNAILEDSKKIGELYQKIYVQGNQNGVLNLNTIKQIVNCLGENGYVAVDSENQINMVHSENVMEFISSVENKKEGEVTILCVQNSGGFIRYDLQTNDGKVQVLRSYLTWNGSEGEAENIEAYSAAEWDYTEEGYLFFAQYPKSDYDEPTGHTAIRVQPLDEKCRALNRSYLMAIGYELNNLFTSNWRERDFKKLNFYDLYEDLHQMKNGQPITKSFLEEGVTYEIPKSEFEDVFQAYFEIDAQSLQQKTIYHGDTETYQYRTRGIYDFAPTPDIPYPEVIAYEENQDGTIKLTVNAVWPKENLGKAFCHEVVIRPMENGGFQFVSNHVIPSDDNVAVTWYTERLTDEKWRENYKEVSE